MAWQQYVTNLMSGDFVLDAAILGHEAGAESVWASNPGGTFGRITPAEIKALVANDRSAMFAGGVTLGGQKCTVLRDALNVDQQHTMDIRTKATDADPDTYSICIAKTNKALVLVKGKKDTHGGKLNFKAFEMADYLRKANY
ncbi:profilin-1 [Denticeps clupeoides]|uniref:Profilin n=1 Tax=Denticeps clupeoides TaxID=299321 RepID=A0AAY4BQ57_9TELE|nr:profilin-1-like [Denticeps clupeoides]